MRRRVLILLPSEKRAGCNVKQPFLRFGPRRLRTWIAIVFDSQRELAVGQMFLLEFPGAFLGLQAGGGPRPPTRPRPS
jgi:hypothetical protein